MAHRPAYPVHGFADPVRDYGAVATSLRLRRVAIALESAAWPPRSQVGGRSHSRLIRLHRSTTSPNDCVRLEKSSGQAVLRIDRPEMT